MDLPERDTELIDRVPLEREVVARTRSAMSRGETPSGEKYRST
jgi:hypothetical protein